MYGCVHRNNVFNLKSLAICWSIEIYFGEIEWCIFMNEFLHVLYTINTVFNDQTFILFLSSFKSDNDPMYNCEVLYYLYKFEIAGQT